ncbi:MAG: Nif3-like dinuclear metal center hexameric protein [Peptostreptococcaceae bacterium]|nr:Nif3-like dinuclear metal center hexameric protein [Peptostreptococcaceae bacterium]
MKIKEFTFLADKIAPLEIQEEWDNSGYQVVTDDKDITGILIALDVTKEVIEEAVFKKANLIVTHHPLLFGEIKTIDYETGTGMLISQLIKNDISLYALHTPFDKVDKGNSFYLGNILNLKNMKRINDYSIVGDLSLEISFLGLIKYCSEELEIPGNAISYIGDSDSLVNKVGICTGSGAEYIDDAIKNKCDVYITGDIKYHDAMRAKIEGFNLLDLGHYGTEKFFIENFFELLVNELDLIGEYIPMYEFIENSDPYKYLEN